MSSILCSFSSLSITSIILLVVLYSTGGTGKCHDNGYVPYTKGLSCISIISSPLLSYNEALNYTVNNLSSNINYELDLLSLSNGNSLDAQVLSLYASRKGIERMWIKCEDNCNGSNCMVYYTNGSIKSIDCTEQLPFVTILSYDITAPNEGIAKLLYVNGSSVTVQVPTNIVIDNSANVTWLHNSVPLQYTDSEGYQLVFDPFIAQNHSGLYQLVLSNEIQGVIVFMIQLEEAIISEFTVAPTNVTIPVGQIAVLECESSLSLPSPTITWSYTNTSGSYHINQLDQMRYRVSTLYTLYIREVATTDSGWYMCTASNIAGSMTASAYLNVITDPLLNSSAVVISQNPRNQSIFVGDMYTIECNVLLSTPQSVDPTSVTSTLYYTYQEIPSTGQMTTRRSVFYYSLIVKDFPSMTFTGLEEGKDQFYCSMNINLQAAQQSIFILQTSVATININVRANVTRLFTSTSSNIIPYGAGLEIYCDFTGPGVNWYFNGHSYLGNITVTGQRSIVTISHFRHIHFGTYQCLTNNNYDMYYRSLTLSVKDGIPDEVSFTVTVITAVSINITLSPPNVTNVIHPHLLQYEVRYRSIQSLVPVGQFISIGPQSSQYFTLQGLLPNTLYQVNMLAYSLTGYSNDNIQVIRTLQQPSGNSQSVSSTVSNSGTVYMNTSTVNTLSTTSTVLTQSIISSTTSTGLMPTIIPLTPKDEGTPVSTVVLSVVLSLTVLIIIIILLIIVIQRCWWNYSGSKGNYSPEKVEELHQRNAMLNFEPQPITPPATGFDSGTDLDSGGSGSVEVIRVDQFYTSTDHIFTYDSLDTLETTQN